MKRQAPAGDGRILGFDDETTVNRDVLVHVKPKGLKRYIEFMSTHYVTNDTDLPIEILAFKVNKDNQGFQGKQVADEDSAEQYRIEPGKRMPISFHRVRNFISSHLFIYVFVELEYGICCTI